MATTKEENYAKLQTLLGRIEARILPNNKYSHLRRMWMLAKCCKSLNYFEKAYERGDVAVTIGPYSAAAPDDSWEKVLNNYLEG